MNDQMPMFDDPIPPAEPVVKKPRQKPTKILKAQIKANKKVRRRKRRTIGVKKYVAKKTESHHGGKYPPHVYNLIGRLMELESPLRNFVMEVAKALTNERPG